MTQTAEKINSQFDYDKKYQKSLRIFHNSYSGDPESKPQSLTNRKQAKNKLYDERKRIAKDHFSDNVHAFRMSDLRRETQQMIHIFDQVDSKEVVKISGRQITLKDYAMRQAWVLSMCSNKVIYQYWPDQKKFEFRHTCRCGQRTCPVCAHFKAVDESKLLTDELTKKLSELDDGQKKHGRLVHIVLTHENVELERIFDIQKVWRHIQQMKKRTYKKKENPYEIWQVLKWGLVRWEATRNEKTGLYHPHLHIMTWVDGWLAPEKGGYWNSLINSWTETCEKLQGLKADWAGQNFSVVTYFSDHGKKAIKSNTTDSISETLLSDAVAEMTKYPVKSTDFTKLKNVKKGENITSSANEFARLCAMMHGKKLINGFGDFKLHQVDESEGEMIHETSFNEEVSDSPCYEVIFTWDRVEKCYKMYNFREWSEDRFRDYILDLQDYKTKHGLVMSYGVD